MVGNFGKIRGGFRGSQSSQSSELTNRIYHVHLYLTLKQVLKSQTFYNPLFQPMLVQFSGTSQHGVIAKYIIIYYS